MPADERPGLRGRDIYNTALSLIQATRWRPGRAVSYSDVKVPVSDGQLVMATGSSIAESLLYRRSLGGGGQDTGLIGMQVAFVIVNVNEMPGGQFRVRGGCWGEKARSAAVEKCTRKGSQPCECGSSEQSHPLRNPGRALADAPERAVHQGP